MAKEKKVSTMSDRRLNVLFVPEWYPLNDGTVVWGQACREHVHAAALYDRVAVLVFAAGQQRWPTLHWQQADDMGVPTFYARYGVSPLPKTTWLIFQLHLRRALQRMIKEWGRPDVIHTQDAHAYYVIKAAQGLGIPFVISQHWTVFMERKLSGRLLRQFRWAFPRAARVLPDSKFAVKEYDYYGVQAAVTWLPNTIDTVVFQPPQSTAREPWLLHASGLSPTQKRFPDIVQAFARVRHKRPEAVLHVAGDGKDRAEMERLATRSLPANSFHFHGYLSKPQLADLMRRASGFVLPSAAENMPCVLIEAIACGCPVLSTRVGGITALVPEGKGLLVDVGDVEQIAEGMCQLLDGTHGLDMDRISYETREQYSREAIGGILHEEYRKAVSGIRNEGLPLSSRRLDLSINTPA